MLCFSLTLGLFSKSRSTTWILAYLSRGANAMRSPSRKSFPRHCVINSIGQWRSSQTGSFKPTSGSKSNIARRIGFSSSLYLIPVEHLLPSDGTASVLALACILSVALLDRCDGSSDLLSRLLDRASIFLLLKRHLCPKRSSFDAVVSLLRVLQPW